MYTVTCFDKFKKPYSGQFTYSVYDQAQACSLALTASPEVTRVQITDEAGKILEYWPCEYPNESYKPL